MPVLRILIADDHSIVRRGLKQILQEGFPSVHIEEAGDSSSLIEKAIQGSWDIIVSDLAMPGGGGLEALRQVKERCPMVPVLILSIYPEEQYAFKVIKAGAWGYLNKDAAPGELVTAVERIIAGKKYLSPGMAEHLSNRLNKDMHIQLHEMLSDREMEVFRLLASGKSISEVSKLLLLRSTTISTYRARILIKMGMKTNADLTRYAVDNALI